MNTIALPKVPAMIEEALTLGRASRAARYYPFVLGFVREFTCGTFAAGTLHADFLSFCREVDALDWVAKINAKNEKDPKKMNYRVVAFRVVQTDAVPS